MDYLPEIEDNFKRHFSKIKKKFGIKNDATCDMPYVILNFKLKSVIDELLLFLDFEIYGHIFIYVIILFLRMILFLIDQIKKEL